LEVGGNRKYTKPRTTPTDEHFNGDLNFDSDHINAVDILESSTHT
jgi:hypothetical protein